MKHTHNKVREELWLQGLISDAEVIEREASMVAEQQGDHSHSPRAWGHSGSLSRRFSRTMVEEEILTDQVTLYERGTTSDTFTLILQGKVLIRTGYSLPGSEM